MPRVTPVSDALRGLITCQDGVVTADQLVEHGFHRATVFRRIREGRWQQILPGVVLTVTGEPTRRQRLVAASLWGGRSAAVDGACACAWYGVPPASYDQNRVHLVVPWDSGLRTRGFVVVRRSMAEIRLGHAGLVRYVDVATALVVAARNSHSPAAANSLLSRGLQQGFVTLGDLREARDRIGDKFCRPADLALVSVGVGIRSPAEEDFRRLVASSRVLPEPLWNQWLDLGDGGYPVCVDGLWIEAGMVHEVNGKRYHAWDRSFDDLHARQSRLTASGLVVVGSTPTRIRRDGPVLLVEVERTFTRNAGRGLPAGVRLIPPPDHRAERTF